MSQLKINKDGLGKKLFQSNRFISILNLTLVLLLMAVLAANQLIIWQVKGLMKMPKMSMNFSWLTAASKSSGSPNLSGDATNDAMKLVISQGVPSIYGAELNVSFDAVEQSMNMMKQFDPTYGQNKITLAGSDLQRFIDVGLKISCEYCCGAKAIINQNGQAACGCAHSQAMRGLLAYLIKNHASEYSNDELLRELARWKGMYFPKQMIQKLAIQLQGADFTPDTASLLLNIKLPDYGKGSQSAPLPSDIENLPGM